MPFAALNTVLLHGQAHGSVHSQFLVHPAPARRNTFPGVRVHCLGIRIKRAQPFLARLTVPTGADLFVVVSVTSLLNLVFGFLYHKCKQIIKNQHPGFCQCGPNWWGADQASLFDGSLVESSLSKSLGPGLCMSLNLCHNS